MLIYKTDGKLIKSGAKYNAFIKAKAKAKFGHTVAEEILKRLKDEHQAIKKEKRANPDSTRKAKTRPEHRAEIEAELGGEVVEVS